MSPLRQNPLAIEHALLGLLQSGPLHGYELFRRAQDPAGLGAVWHIKQAHLYALLARLEGQGLVAGRHQAQPDRPARKVLGLTPAGRQALALWLESPVPRGREVRVEFLAKLYFAQQAGPAAVRRLVAAQRRALMAWRAALAAAPAASGPPVAFACLVERYRQGQIEAMLAWLQAVEQALPLAAAPEYPARPAEPAR